MTERAARPTLAGDPPVDPRRRAVLRLGGLAAGALLASACGWDGGRTARPALRLAGRWNDWLGERLVSRRLAPELPVAARTGAAFPVYFVSPRLPRLADPAAWALEVGGEVRRTLRLDAAALAALPRLTYTVRHHCVEGWTAVATWTGVPFATIAALADPTPAARYVRFESFDAGYANGWDLASAMHPQTILAYGKDDRPLGADHGAPLRLYSPVKLGYKLTKYLTRVSFTRERPGGYWEDRGYPWFGGL